jgi:hypothetical protein
MRSAQCQWIQAYCVARTFEVRAFSPLSYFRIHAYSHPSATRPEIDPAPTRIHTQWNVVHRYQTLISYADGRSRIHGLLPLLRAQGERNLCRRS